MKRPPKMPPVPAGALRISGPTPWSEKLKYPVHHRLRYWVDPGDLKAIADNEICNMSPTEGELLLTRIAAGSRVQFWREDSRTAVDVATGEVDVEFFTVSRRAEAVLSWCEAIFPKRVAEEEIGDALELINRWQCDPTCGHVNAKIAVKVVSTVFVLVLNSIRFLVSSIKGSEEKNAGK